MTSVDNIDLTIYKLDELHELQIRVEEEISRKEKERIYEARNRMEQIAGELNMSIDEVMTFDARKKRKVNTCKAIKYRNPKDHSQTWAGRGKRPKWLQEALDHGAELEHFSV